MRDLRSQHRGKKPESQGLLNCDVGPASLYRVVIHGRSKERSDAAQTRGSMPRPQSTRYGTEFCTVAFFEQGRGMDPRVSATSLRSCFALG
ncbi:MAG: hypothetical protein EOS27_03755 [Mesorhizobium sp.]|nr:MAG: hypothetical protein EOS27_03755 [Mesorhizobium sp.]TIX26639.1 MAG: hypothetical protein E5V35_09800 [Mesorhizobium sp.]